MSKQHLGANWIRVSWLFASVVLVSNLVWARSTEPSVSQSLSKRERNRIEADVRAVVKDFQDVLKARDREMRLHVGDLAPGLEQRKLDNTRREQAAERARKQHIETRTVYRSEEAEALEQRSELEIEKRRAKQEEQRLQFVETRNQIRALLATLPKVDESQELRLGPWVETDFKSSDASPNGFKKTEGLEVAPQDF